MAPTDPVMARLTDLKDFVRDRFDSVDSRLDRGEERFKAIEDRLTSSEATLGEHSSDLRAFTLVCGQNHRGGHGTTPINWTRIGIVLGALGAAIAGVLEVFKR